MSIDAAEWDATLARWRRVTTLPEQADLVVRWLAGEHPYLPWHPGPPDPETQALLQMLTEINRAGLVTHWSRPGEDTPQWRQRASLAGYGEPQLVERVRLAAAAAGLIVQTSPGSDWVETDRPVVSQEADGGDWVDRTRAGLGSLGDMFPWWDETLNPQAQKVLSNAALLDVVDPEWGREDVLWRVVLTAVTAGVKPPFG